ncbi:MAG: efflux RND transporter periplasmic adaptor subunit [Betaproteobacteria bacterium]|nr:efflux RND transporter periplasmic adaptor subunit [Betaproteobacteria bacterium]
MKTGTVILTAAGLAIVSAAIYGAYRIGVQHAMAPAGSGTITTTKTDAAAGAAPQKPGDIDPATGRRVLYWHDPMTPGPKFDKPGKSPFMNMALEPVFADSATDDGTVTISPRVQQSLGVRVAEVGVSTFARAIEAPGTVAWNDRDVAVVSTRVAGTIEKLHARAARSRPRRAALCRALRAGLDRRAGRVSGGEKTERPRPGRPRRCGAHPDADHGHSPEEVIKALEASGQVQRRMTLYAPVSGVIAELAVREGANVMPGTMLARINSLATVWIHAEVPETNSAGVRLGMRVKSRVAGLPDATFPGTVAAILPEVNAATRTVRVRIETRNPGGRLRPGMFATIDFTPAAKREFLVVPSEAVIRTGTRTVVIAAEEGGKFRAVDIETGDEGNGQTEIRKGLQRGQRIVASGQFMIDSETSLKSALTRMSEPVAAATPAGHRRHPPTTRRSDGRAGSGAGTCRVALRPAATAHRPARHDAEGVVEAVAKDAVTLSHGPVPALRWPAMTMDFKPPAGGMPASIKPGTRVRFSFRQAGEGEFAIVAIQPAPAVAGAKR